MDEPTPAEPSRIPDWKLVVGSVEAASLALVSFIVKQRFHTNSCVTAQASRRPTLHARVTAICRLDWIHDETALEEVQTTIAFAMAEHKPLPALPTPSLTTLSVDARAHRGRLIRHLLAEVISNDPAVQVRLQEGWASALESALDDFSDNISRGGWLAGIRRRVESKYTPPRSQNSITLKDVGRVQSSNAIIQTRILPPAEEDPRPRTPLDLLEQLRKQVLQNTTVSVPGDKCHLLICLAPYSYGAHVHFPPTEYGSDNTQTHFGCTFAPLKYLLPADAEHIETTVLYGLTEWDSKFRSSQRLRTHISFPFVFQIRTLLHPV